MVDQAASDDTAADHDNLGVVFQDGLNRLCHRQADPSRRRYDTAISDDEEIARDVLTLIAVARIGVPLASVNAPAANI